MIGIIILALAGVVFNLYTDHPGITERARRTASFASLICSFGVMATAPIYIWHHIT